MVHFRHADSAVGEPFELARCLLSDIEGMRGVRKEMPRTPYFHGTIQIRDVIVIGDHESQYVGGHDGRRLEVCPQFSIGRIDLRSPGRHIRQRCVIRIVLYGKFEGSFYGGLVPARKRLPRRNWLEMRCCQPSVNSL